MATMIFNGHSNANWHNLDTSMASWITDRRFRSLELMECSYSLRPPSPQKVLMLILVVVLENSIISTTSMLEAAHSIDAPK